MNITHSILRVCRWWMYAVLWCGPWAPRCRPHGRESFGLGTERSPILCWRTQRVWVKSHS